MLLTLPVETLKLIQETAVNASGLAYIQDVQIGYNKYRRILADGTCIDTEIEPDAMVDTLGSLDDLSILYQQFPNSQIWVNSTDIKLLYDATKRHQGYATLSVESSKIADNLRLAESNSGNVCNPDQFEQIGMMLFDLPDEFLDEIRSLQWRKKKESVKVLESASKSTSADDLQIVLNGNNEVFRSRRFIVTTPIYMSPYETKTETIECKLFVDAAKETITYSPKIGTMEKLFRKAFEELRDTIIRDYKIDRNRIFCGDYSADQLFKFKK